MQRKICCKNILQGSFLPPNWSKTVFNQWKLRPSILKWLTWGILTHKQTVYTLRLIKPKISRTVVKMLKSHKYLSTLNGDLWSLLLEQRRTPRVKERHVFRHPSVAVLEMLGTHVGLTPTIGLDRIPPKRFKGKISPYEIF